MNEQTNGKYVIEKGIPLIGGSRENGSSKYPFRDLEVGDSFLFTGKRELLQSACSIFKIRTGRKFTIRKVEGWFRVWRVEG